MKRKLWIIITVCLAVLLILAACLAGYCLRQGISISHARYLETLHGHMLIIDGSPVSMSGNDALFDGLTTGDEVLVAHGMIAESYPGQAKAYLCIKRADGSEADIAADLLQNLTEMGWLS